MGRTPSRWEEWADDAAADVVEAVLGGPGAPPPPVGEALAAARRLEPCARALGERSRPYLSTLATLGALDLTLARVVEPHLDAVAILAQAGGPDLSRVGVGDGSTFGVYAAHASGTGLTLSGDPGAERLDGTKPWCSLAGDVSHALVTAAGADGAVLCVAPLRDPGVSVEESGWVSRGLASVTTSTVTMGGVPATPVGPPGFYLDRPGFAWGGIGVAAVWFGAAAALAGRLRGGRPGREPDQIALAHLGRADLVVHAALVTLRDAATEIDRGRARGAAGQVLAARVRGVVADTAERVLGVVGHALGPSPLVHDEEHARRVADLTVYVRQHHAERDHAALGALHVDGRGGS